MVLKRDLPMLLLGFETLPAIPYLPDSKIMGLKTNY
jgi:hypothetical protein